ncbi:aldo/keto reductase [Phytohalomonas tamaricis]|uniref:aldo/keto reductase n=1 Tax=Phytohalomonas tamaricis TaxID=2081032 RepID=UPI000D0ABAD4|nr:aldo/keto reductase [Phytohalomonas tamaricis]
MKKVALGTSSIDIAPLVFGGNVFGWTLDETQSFAMLDAYLDAGFDCLDTADVYSRWAEGHQGGESERVIGKWLARSGKRDRIVLATKVGMDMGEGRKGLSKEYIIAAVEDSLKRLQTDYIDLYQSHTDDQNTPLEETLEAYQRLIEQGKVRAIGASNYSADRLDEALQLSQRKELPSYSTLQPHYNLYDRHEFEHELEAICLKYGLGVIPYFSLASGFLTGKYRSREDAKGRAREQFVNQYFDARGERILSALDEVANAYDTTPAAVSLAWLLSRPAITAPIASATSQSQLEQLIQATRLELDQPALDRLDNASATE